MTHLLKRLAMTLAVVALLGAQAHALEEDDAVALCGDTGGQWNECGSGCGPLTCDQPALEPGTACPAVCTPLCACPEATPLWDETLGCIAEAECDNGQGGDPTSTPEMVACAEAGGQWNECGSGCGPLTCDQPVPDPDMSCPSVCTEMCDCPAATPLWGGEQGCIAEADCDGGEPGDPAPIGMGLCEQTGGQWDWCGSGCGPMGCGDDPADFAVCDDVCLEQCACPDSAPLWDDTDG